MGCCETRDKPIKESTILTLPTDGPTIFSDLSDLKIPSWHSLPTPHSLEIFEFLQKLIDSEAWQPSISEPNFSAEKMTGSPFNKSSLVSKLLITFPVYVPLNLILDLFLIPEKRKKWDPCVRSFEVLEKSAHELVLHSKIKVLFYAADLIEQIFVVFKEQTVFIISFSVEHPKVPHNKDCVRAEKVFGCIRIGETGGRSQITAINQVDPKSKLDALASSVGMMQLKLWADSLKKRVLKIMKADSELAPKPSS